MPATTATTSSTSIACGARNDDYHWTEVLMEKAGRRRLLGGPFMDGLALHYYTSVKRLPDGTRMGRATQFDEAEWIEIVSKGLFMDELVRTPLDDHGQIRPGQEGRDDRGRVGHLVCGRSRARNPRFLYQQNTMRDAIVAATTLDIFNKHCDRVRMANIAQTVNVLQAMVLTDKEKMLLTPSYHVFEMYSAHQDATMVPVDVQSERYELRRLQRAGGFGLGLGGCGWQAAHDPEQRQPEQGHPGEGACRRA